MCFINKSVIHSDVTFRQKEINNVLSSLLDFVRFLFMFDPQNIARWEKKGGILRKITFRVDID